MKKLKCRCPRCGKRHERQPREASSELPYFGNGNAAMILRINKEQSNSTL